MTGDLVSRLHAFSSITADHPHGGSFLDADAVKLVDEAACEIERLSSIIDNALQAFAETHDSNEARCRLMAAHLHEVYE